jgi:hypothetical protein
MRQLIRTDIMENLRLGSLGREMCREILRSQSSGGHGPYSRRRRGPKVRILPQRLRPCRGHKLVAKFQCSIPYYLSYYEIYDIEGLVPCGVMLLYGTQPFRVEETPAVWRTWQAPEYLQHFDKSPCDRAKSLPFPAVAELRTCPLEFIDERTCGCVNLRSGPLRPHTDNREVASIRSTNNFRLDVTFGNLTPPPE